MATIPKYEMHPLTEVFPPMDPDQFDDLKASIATNGQRNPITIWHNQIIDGRHRYLACTEMDIEPIFQFLEDDADPLVYVVELNGLRRHMNTSQRAMVAAQLSMKPKPGRNSGPNNETVVSITQASNAFAVSERMVYDARKVIEYGDEELIRRCKMPSSVPQRERLAVSNAAEIVTGNLEREQAAAKARWEEQEETKRLIAEMEANTAAQIDEAVEEERRKAAEAERQRVLAEKGLTEEYQAELERVQQRAAEQEQRRQAAEAERARVQEEQAQAEQERQARETQLQEQAAALEAERQQLNAERERIEAERAAAEQAAAQAAHASGETIAAARAFLDGVRLDPLSTDDNAAVQAQNYFTDPDHSLRQSWEADTLWLEIPNDPTAGRDFADKLITEVVKYNVKQAIAVAGVNHAGSEWGQRLVSHCSAFCLLKSDAGAAPRMAFLLGDNSQAEVDSFADQFSSLGVVCLTYFEPSQ